MFITLFRHVLLVTALAASFISHATQYPVTVTDLDGQNVTLKQEPRRIVLQDGRDIMALALLDRENPFQRLVAWNNLPRTSDTATWNILKSKWPQAASILEMGFSDKGDIELESVLAQRPDLMIAQMRAKPTLTESGVISKLRTLGIPVLFIDYEVSPIKNTAESITLLGRVLNREDNAKAYTDFYRQHLAAIQQRTANLSPKANVFVEALAGRSESCCFSHAHNGWGGLVEAAGARNIGSELLPGANGYVSLEKLISMKPDVYIMTGSTRGNGTSPLLPLGYSADKAKIDARGNQLLSRTGVAQIPAVQEKHAFGLYHHFYNHPYNIIGVEYLTKAIYPHQFTDLNPDESYREIIRRFTTLPDNEFIFSWKQAK
ncbi:MULTISPECIES: ABC transporter substrate-binding protein [Lonsdalea]|uniref:ABC transporter substrate-binding protein n=2 Tax=Lonsdalea TaxID=1082702 RepID=A0ACD1JDY7_9GAMM|nr:MULTISPECIES: ABC transporter substrate-binding protein [Lonsdalea]OSM97992.1 ABC transporter substrate-binding protein [Lonsdalea populi]QPQ23348.1 ABC transporter substrate-binding protein [Lonsdalea populi]RAT14567.1 ABC transporter substrate-binding protein [Lonsdalea quercina]RAT15997.1 ABC transporter substrate-binding protein [Lonsdalea quercina]RAT19839.1 ABC transporter substrate-binding protein [Lonsdalea populi]